MQKLSGLFIAATGALAGVLQAATAPPSPLPVSATVQATCSASAGSLSFGNYTPGAGARTGSTTVNVKCTKNTGFTVALNIGATTGATFAQRLMASGANTLQYNLYTTAGFASVFGDGTLSTLTSGGTGAGVATLAPVSVFGQLPDSATNQLAVPGSYSDIVTVTVTY